MRGLPYALKNIAAREVNPERSQTPQIHEANTLAPCKCMCMVCNPFFAYRPPPLDSAAIQT